MKGERWKRLIARRDRYANAVERLASISIWKPVSRPLPKRKRVLVGRRPSGHGEGVLKLFERADQDEIDRVARQAISGRREGGDVPQLQQLEAPRSAIRHLGFEVNQGSVAGSHNRLR
jgi:hypothetical protein